MVWSCGAPIRKLLSGARGHKEGVLQGGTEARDWVRQNRCPEPAMPAGRESGRVRPGGATGRWGLSGPLFVHTQSVVETPSLPSRSS